MLSLREYKEEYHLFTNICLNITNACNLQCRYCFVEQKPEYMTLQVAKDAVDFLYNNVKRKRKICKNNNIKGNINFFGGEPMLLFKEIIVPLVEYVENTYSEVFTFGITTNGTLLTEDIIEYFYNHNISILLSIDGNKETQDYNRPCINSNKSSFDMIKPIIPTLLKHFPNTCFRMTIYEETCDKLFENILFAQEMGFKNIFFCVDSRNNFLEKNQEKLKIELEKIFLYFTGSLINNFPLPNISPIDSALTSCLRQNITNNILPEENLLSRDIFRCGLGTTSASIGPSGDIYACQEQTSQNSEENPFYIGNIYQGIDNEKHINLLENYRSLKPIVCEDIEMCKNCKLKNICYEIRCPSASMFRFNDFFIRSKTECFYLQTVNELAQGLLSIENKNIEKFIRYKLKLKEEGDNIGIS